MKEKQQLRVRPPVRQLCARLSSGALVTGFLHGADDYCWTFIRKDKRKTRVALSGEAMQAVVMIYARLLRRQVDTEWKSAPSWSDWVYGRIEARRNGWDGTHDTETTAPASVAPSP